jgi:hypothetical protein
LQVQSFIIHTSLKTFEAYEGILLSGNWQYTYLNIIYGRNLAQCQNIIAIKHDC